jgi:FkbM family methyltransferase
VNFKKLTSYLDNPKTILDIGAFKGEFSQTLSTFYPDAEFILNEANPYLEPELKKLPFSYQIKPLTRYGETKLFFIQKDSPIGTGASFYKENTHWYSEGNYSTLNLESTTLDSQNYFQDRVIDLMKLDVQGSELDIMKGGSETLKRTKFILLECSLIPYNHNAPLMDVVLEYLEQQNFKVVDIIDYLKDYNRILQLDVLVKNASI